MSKPSNRRDASALFSAAERTRQIVESRSEAFINATEHREGPWGVVTCTTLCPEALASTPSELVELHLAAASLYDAAAALWLSAGKETTDVMLEDAHEARQIAAGIRGYYMDWDAV